MLFAALLVLSTVARATSVDFVESQRPDVFPRAREVPRNAHFLVLGAWPAAMVELRREDGRRVRALARPAGLASPIIEVIPRKLLDAGGVYCISIRGPRPPAASERSCVQVSDQVDEAPPVGGMATEISIEGRWARIHVLPGEDQSAVALVIEVSGWTGVTGGVDAVCSDIATWIGPMLHLGAGIELYDEGPGAGTACFPRNPPETPLSVRLRWRDAAGNLGPWSGPWTIPVARPAEGPGAAPG